MAKPLENGGKILSEDKVGENTYFYIISSRHRPDARYSVSINFNTNEHNCTCPGYTYRHPKDPTFQCAHIKLGLEKAVGI